MAKVEHEELKGFVVTCPGCGNYMSPVEILPTIDKKTGDVIIITRWMCDSCHSGAVTQ